MVTKKNWLITQQQISELRIEDVLLAVDPEQLSDAQIFNLRGAVHLRVEGVTRPADLFAQPGPRKFFQGLHQRWPYASYFLRVKPVTLDSPLHEIIDLSLFMALALCHVQELSYLENAHGVLLKYDAGQLGAHLDDLACRAGELADCMDYPTTEIVRREALVAAAVASFFATGKALNQKRNAPRKKN